MFVTVCPQCKKRYVPDLLTSPDAADKNARRAEEFVREIWPDSSLEQREQLLSGICSDECWDAYWEKPEGDIEDPEA